MSEPLPHKADDYCLACNRRLEVGDDMTVGTLIRPDGIAVEMFFCRECYYQGAVTEYTLMAMRIPTETIEAALRGQQ